MVTTRQPIVLKPRKPRGVGTPTPNPLKPGAPGNPYIAPGQAPPTINNSPLAPPPPITGGAGGAGGAGAGGASPYDALYDQRTTAALNQRNATMAANTYARFLSQTRGNRDLANNDLSRSLGLGKLGASYWRRGLGTSGIFQNAQTQYANDWTTSRNDLMDALRSKLAEYDASDANAQSMYQTTLGNIAAEKLRDILATAGQLSSPPTVSA